MAFFHGNEWRAALEEQAAAETERTDGQQARELRAGPAPAASATKSLQLIYEGEPMVLARDEAVWVPVKVAGKDEWPSQEARMALPVEGPFEAVPGL